MNTSTAYQIGQTVGALLGVLILLGGFVFFVIALVKAIKTGRKAWIVTASVFSLPIVAIFALFLYGVFVGINRAAGRSHEMHGAKQGEPSELLTAAMSPIEGRTLIPYTISLPWAGEWGKQGNQPPFDYMFSYRELYIGVIVEGIGLGSPQKTCDFAQKNIQGKATKCSFTEPVEIKIGDINWLSFDASATVSNMDFKYRYFVYADKGRTAQILCWTGPVLFDRYAPVMNRIAQSFHFTEAK